MCVRLVESSWLYKFGVKHNVRDSRLFLKTLLLERPDFGERILLTRSDICKRYLKKLSVGKVRIC